MGVSVRKKGNDFYVFIRHAGQRAAHRCESLEHAEETRRAVSIAIAANQFTIAPLKRKLEEKPETPALPTLSAFYKDTMLPLWESSVAPGTATRYGTSFEIHILPALGDIPIDQITRDKVKSFVAALRKKVAHKRTDNEEERKLSKDSIRLIVAALRAALSEAMEQKKISSNPAVRLGKFYREAGKVREEVDPFRAEEIPILLDVTRKSFGFENYVTMLLLFHSGMRSGEVAGLRWEDIDFQERFITVRRQLHAKRTKTKKLRRVDISDVLLLELQALKKRRQEDHLARGKNEIPETVFLSPGLRKTEGKRSFGAPLDMDNWRNRVLWKACDKAGIRRRRLHDTRHSFASILLMAGESPAYVRDQLGHSSIKMTVDIYSHFIPGANRQAVNRLPVIKQELSKSVAGGLA